MGSHPDNIARSRGAGRPRFGESLPPRRKRGRRSATRRTNQAAPHRRDVTVRLCLGRGGAPLSRARSPCGAPPRRSSKRPNASAQPRPRFARPRGHGRYPHHRSHLSGAPRAPVVMPAGTMPGPPGSGVTSPARRNRTRSMFRRASRTRPSVSGMMLCTRNGDECQWKSDGPRNAAARAFSCSPSS
jgi:hypothetical protein